MDGSKDKIREALHNSPSCCSERIGWTVESHVALLGHNNVSVEYRLKNRVVLQEALEEENEGRVMNSGLQRVQGMSTVEGGDSCRNLRRHAKFILVRILLHVIDVTLAWILSLLGMDMKFFEWRAKVFRLSYQ